MFFDDWSNVFRILIVGSLTYIVLVAVLRVSGKRTLAKLNAFDLVVTVAFGSALATVALSSDVAFLEGVTALALFVVAQLAVSWLSTRFGVFRKLTRSEPTLLVRDGELLAGALDSHRMTESEVHQAVRSEGFGGLDQIAAVVLETDGTLSVISRDDVGDAGVLREVRGATAERSVR